MRKGTLNALFNCEIRSVLCREPDGFLHAYSACDVLSRDVESRAVIHGCPEYGHAVGDRDGAVEVEGLGGDVALVVIEGQHGVVLSESCLVEH